MHASTARTGKGTTGTPQHLAVSIASGATLRAPSYSKPLREDHQLAAARIARLATGGILKAHENLIRVEFLVFFGSY